VFAAFYGAAVRHPRTPALIAPALASQRDEYERLCQVFLGAAKLPEAEAAAGTALFEEELSRFVGQGSAILPAVREGIRRWEGPPMGAVPRMVGLRVARSVPEPLLRELLPELVFLCSWPNGMLGAALDLILSLPRDWVLSRVEEIAEPILSAGPEDWPYILRLYRHLDPNLHSHLLARAAASPDPEIRYAAKQLEKG